MCRNEYNKEEDKDDEEVLKGQLEASQSEIAKVQEENRTLKEFMQSFGDQIKESNEKLGIQMQT
jgi:TRAP-type C4-dicarboxylate transport system substrate-binding protein